METTLLIVTMVSVGVGAAMGFFAWRMARDERRRSAARVAALSSAASAGLPLMAAEPLADAVPIAPVASSAAIFSAPVNQIADDAIASTAVPEMLSSTGQPATSAGRQRSLAIAAAVLLTLLLGGLAWTWNGRASNLVAATASDTPLELLSLRHERHSSKLAVSGLVRNSATGRAVNHLSAVVFLFDQQGAFVTSAKAPVDFVRLGAGDESPFVVTLEAPATVVRYRVSFRTDEGVMPHVDRRDSAPVGAEAQQAVSLKVK